MERSIERKVTRLSVVGYPLNSWVPPLKISEDSLPTTYGSYLQTVGLQTQATVEEFWLRILYTMEVALEGLKAGT